MRILAARDEPAETLSTMKTRMKLGVIFGMLVGGIPLTPTVRAQVFETEPNDTLPQANAMPDGVYVLAQLLSQTDVDTFSRTVPSAGGLSLSFSSDSNALSGDFLISVLNASGTTLAAYNTGYSRSFSQLVGVPAAGTYFIRVRKVDGTFGYSNAQYSIAATHVPLIPVITGQPANQSASAGGSAAFSVTANGMPPLSYQWFWNGTALSGQTSASMSFTNLQPVHSGGRVTVIVSNVSGSATSAEAMLTVTVQQPTITAHPVSQSITSGRSVSLTVVATGTAPFMYQWRKNGTAIIGATTSSYSIASVSDSDAGSYSVTVSNAAGSVTSNAAILTVAAPPNPARLINLSVMLEFSTNQSLTTGFVIGGGSRRVLVRAVGPSLRAFNVSPTMANPRLTLFNAQGTAIGSNDNWSASDAATMAAVGAFALPAFSLDAALVATLPPGNYSVTVGGNVAAGDSGYALVEVYEVP
jgi:hypothetical protein